MNYHSWNECCDSYYLMVQREITNLVRQHFVHLKDGMVWKKALQRLYSPSNNYNFKLSIMIPSPGLLLSCSSSLETTT